VYLLVFAGAVVRIDYGVVLEGVLMVLLVPLILAWLFRRGAEAAKGPEWLGEAVLPKASVTLSLQCSVRAGGRGAGLRGPRAG
jgi:arsenite transporter